MEHRATGPQGSPSSNGPALPLCSWTRKLGTPYGPGPSTGTTQRNNRDPPPAYDTQRRYRRARVSASSLDGDGTWCTTHATANKPPTNEDAQTCGPGAGLALGLGGISSDGLGVTGRVCDAASPHGCRHASPEHPGMPGDSDTCATNIEYCPSSRLDDIRLIPPRLTHATKMVRRAVRDRGAGGIRPGVTTSVGRARSGRCSDGMSTPAAGRDQEQLGDRRLGYVYTQRYWTMRKPRLGSTGSSQDTQRRAQ